MVETPIFEPVSRPRQQVEHQLRRAILGGVYRAGHPLPSEAELARQFGVSRNTIREALRSLAAAGLVRSAPGARGGTFVSVFRGDELSRIITDSLGMMARNGDVTAEHLSTAREVLEIPTARLAAINRSADDIGRLEAIIEALKAKTVGDPEIPLLDVEFHSAIAAASGNPILAMLVRSVHSALLPVTHLVLRPAVGARAVRQHIALYKAIAQQNPDAAEHEIREHLHDLAQEYRQLSAHDGEERPSAFAEDADRPRRD